jgi:hypothetical protein
VPHGRSRVRMVLCKGWVRWGRGYNKAGVGEGRMREEGKAI